MSAATDFAAAATADRGVGDQWSAPRTAREPKAAPLLGLLFVPGPSAAQRADPLAAAATRVLGQVSKKRRVGGVGGEGEKAFFWGGVQPTKPTLSLFLFAAAHKGVAPVLAARADFQTPERDPNAPSPQVQAAAAQVRPMDQAPPPAPLCALH